MSETTKTHDNFVLPASVVSRVDVSRLMAELERLDNDLTAESVRAKVGSEGHIEPTVSRQMADFLSQNELKLENSHERSELVKQLRQLKDKVPVIHMTFATVADPESLQQLTKWLRESVHPQAVIEVGLQPALVAGVYLRTPNHVHDLSLRAMLSKGRDVLKTELETLRGKS